MGRAASVRRQKLQHRVVFPDFSAFQMTIDAVPVRPDPAGADGGAGEDSVRPPGRQDTLGADAWPSFTRDAATAPRGAAGG